MNLRKRQFGNFTLGGILGILFCEPWGPHPTSSSAMCPPSLSSLSLSRTLSFFPLFRPSFPQTLPFLSIPQSLPFLSIPQSYISHSLSNHHWPPLLAIFVSEHSHYQITTITSYLGLNRGQEYVRKPTRGLSTSATNIKLFLVKPGLFTC